MAEAGGDSLPVRTESRIPQKDSFIQWAFGSVQRFFERQKTSSHTSTEKSIPQRLRPRQIKRKERRAEEARILEEEKRAASIYVEQAKRRQLEAELKRLRSS